MNKRFATWAAIFAAVVIVAVGAFFGVHALMDSGPATWKPTAAESDLAIKVAQQEALTTVPIDDGSPSGTPTVDATGWPTNVRQVTVVKMARTDSGRFVGADASGDDREVLVVQMVGSFSVLTTGPPGAADHTRGGVMTIVVDATSGELLDFGLEPTAHAHLIPNPVTIFRR